MSLLELPRKKKLELLQILEEREIRSLRQTHLHGAKNERGEFECGLIRFIRTFWHILEPVEPFVSGWAFAAICEHLEAVSRGEITRLLINVPPGFSKSTCVNVWWPLWEWTVLDRADHRYVSFSYAAHLTRRDNRKMLSVLHDPLFKKVWGDCRGIELTKDGEELIGNSRTGFKLATSVGGVGTGERGSRVLCDDLHNVHEAESDVVRTGTVRWFREAASNRLNNIAKDAIIVIGQRTHEDDVSGAITSDQDGLGYTHLRIPMEFNADSMWAPSSGIGWTDPRVDPEFRAKNGVLAWPERYPASSLAEFKSLPFMWSAQYMQDPAPRGGAIIQRSWWNLWRPVNANETEIGDGCPHCGSPKTKHLEGRGLLFECGACGQKFKGKKGKFPHCDFVLASLDTAYTKDERNDPSAMTVWGIFKHPTTKVGGVMLMDAWRKWLPIRGRDVPREANEDEGAWRARAEPEWGLVEWTWHTCRKFKVHHLLIEGKASGISLQQELQLQHRRELWMTEMVNPEGDKEARAYSVQGIFAQGLVWAPNRAYADMVINEMALFPFGRFKDLTDTATMALRRLRDMGRLEFEDERLSDHAEGLRHRPRSETVPLYPV